MAVFVVTAPDGKEYEVTAPESATEEQALAYAQQQFAAGSLAPAAPSGPAAPAAQADVRKAEATEQPYKFEITPSAAFGVPPKGFGMGITDEEMLKQLAETGELKYGDSVPYGAAKIAASMAGYAASGPLGATALETLVRQRALLHNLDKAVSAGAIDYDRAVEIFAKESAGGAAEDLAWNTAVPFLGAVAQRTPGLRPFIQKLAQRISQKIPRGPGGEIIPADIARATERDAAFASETTQRAAKVSARVEDAATPAAKQAVEELSGRMGDHVLTPGQVTGKASFTEKVGRSANKDEFAAQEKALQAAGESLRVKTFGATPIDQPSGREEIGSVIQTLADDAQKAMKLRLRPVFKAADASGVKVDFTGVLARAKAALAADNAVPGGRLVASERAQLGDLIADLEKLASPAIPASAGKPAGSVASSLLDARGAPIMKATPAGPGTPAVPAVPPIVGAEQALDFISRQKEKLRAVTADWKPSKFYETIMGGIRKQADTAFETAAAGARGPGGEAMVSELRQAQTQYRTMMETVYEDAVKQALKTNKPEDIGRFFWQTGNVTEIKQLRRLRALAMGEGVMGEGLAATKAAQDQTRAMARGFLQEAVPNIDHAARWSTMLHEKPGLRDTWNTLTAAPGGKELRSAMEVLEQAAQMAVRGSEPISGFGSAAIRRAEAGALGTSFVTGTIHIPMLAIGIAAVPLMKVLGTAYSQGNKGILNMVARTLRAGSAGTAAGAKAMQASLPVLEEYAAEHGITDLFIGKSTEGQPSEPEPTQPAR